MLSWTRASSRGLFIICLAGTGCGGGTSSSEGTGGNSPGGQCESDADCSNGEYCDGEEVCSPEDSDADEEGCVAATTPCQDDEVCSESEESCTSNCDIEPDADGDGHDAVECGGDDCDDSDNSRYPGNSELCDGEGHDEDCDPTTLGGRDEDGDGFVAEACCNEGENGLRCGNDCDDDRTGTFPGATETCNGVDDDCDTQVDDELPLQNFVPDCDGDDFGDETAEPIVACSAPDEPPPCTDGAWVTVATDCDDEDSGTNPGVGESCNGEDDDCDGASDEGLQIEDYYPDCDEDGYADDALASVPGCGAPNATPACDGPGGDWATLTGDCADDDAARNPGEAESCNAVDDDCDSLTDDIVSNTVVCEAGQNATCTNACGVAGTTTCRNDCLAFLACSSSASEVCNYCDDDGDGNFYEEKPMATHDGVDEWFSCSDGGDVFGVAACEAVPEQNGTFALEAVLLDGSANDTAGAVWLSPAEMFTGWGPVEIVVQLQVRGVPDAGTTDAEVPNGGWAVVLATGGNPGVGTPQSLGIPGGLTGIAAKWHWSTYETCFSSAPPSQGDSVSFVSLPGARRCHSGTGSNTTWSCSTGDSISPAFDGDPGWQTQTLTLTYTPDDPTTLANEESVVMGGRTYTPGAQLGCGTNNDLPIGSNIRIGLTAGTFVDSGFQGPPPDFTFGVPVEARVRLWHFTPPSGPGQPQPVYSDQQALISRDSLCLP